MCVAPARVVSSSSLYGRHQESCRYFQALAKRAPKHYSILQTERLMTSHMQDQESPSAQPPSMRPAEPARVVGVEYFIAGEQQTWMRLKLALTDDSSPLEGKPFTVDLPSPQTDFGDFIILRSRWDAVMQQHWRVGDACQVRDHHRDIWSDITGSNLPRGCNKAMKRAHRFAYPQCGATP